MTNHYVSSIILLLILHFIGDFLLQNNWMALGKSKTIPPLTFHVLVYSLCFTVFGFKMFVTTFYLHWITDFITSRLTSKLWFVEMNIRGNAVHYDMEKRHWFFVGIGADQLIHMVSLIVSAYLLGVL